MKTLDDLMTSCWTCQKCKLRIPQEDAYNPVIFGTGNHNADLMFIGEAPGYWEEKEGEPFVGRAGKLLTSLIEVGMKIQRKDVYICNIIKCRPPDNRDPEEDEIKECSHWLKKQIELVNPKVIMTVGRFSSQYMLGKENTATMRGMRGRAYLINNRIIVPTYHTAYCLRNPSSKELLWADAQIAMKALNGDLTTADLTRSSNSNS